MTKATTIIAAALLVAVGAHAQTDIQALKARAEAGDAFAQYNLGYAYDLGEGVPQNHVEAIRWWREAAEQGHAAAQYNLGLAYFKGEGVPQNFRMGVQWFTKAGEQGNADAQLLLGAAYATALGVPQNNRVAVQWLTKAGEQGNVDAQLLLGVVYFFDAPGAKKDSTEVYIWASLAKAKLANLDAEESKQVNEIIEALTRKMTPAQLQKAQDLALGRFNEIEARKAQNR